MRLTVLGSGSCELRADRSSPAYLLEAADSCVLLDCGQGCWRRLVDAGRRPVEVKAILLSHHHLDHMADLLPLLFALNYDPELANDARMTLVADIAVEAVLEGLGRVFGRWVQPSSSVFTTRFVQSGALFECGGLVVSAARSSHIQSSLAFRLQWRGASVVYLGDSLASDELTRFAAGADLLVCHTVGSAVDPHPLHMHATAAGELAQAAGVGALLLSHFYRATDPGRAVHEAQLGFGGPVFAARDLMTLAIDAEAAVDAGVKRVSVL